MSLALPDLERRLADVHADARSVRVQRFDPKKSGELFVQVEVDDDLCWYACDAEGRTTRLLPEDDGRIPLAARLPALREEAEVRVLAYRPERRLVLWVEDEHGPRVLKGYRKRRVAASARNHRRAAEALETSALSLPRLRDVDEELSCMHMEAVLGVPLSLAPRNDDAYFRIGAALHDLQGGRTDSLPSHGVSDELGVLDTFVQKTRAAGVALPPAWAELRRRVGESAAATEQVPAGLVHRDLHDGQFLENRHGLVVLDFDLLSVGDPLLDVANLVSHLKLRELQGLRDVGERSVDVLGRALLDGLGRDEEPLFVPRLRFYQASTFLRLTLVYALRRRWAHLCPDLMELARRCVDDR